jgi:hypothetical protein
MNIIIGSDITSINQDTFRNCVKLRDVIIPKSVKRIEQNAFIDCYSLKNIIIPEGVMEIYSHAFYKFKFSNQIWSYLDRGMEVYCKSQIPPKAMDIDGNLYIDSFTTWDAFPHSSFLEHIKIYVPTQSVQNYKEANGWKEYSDQIIGYDFENNPIH